MILASTPPSTTVQSRLETRHASIRTRLDASTMALLQTRDQVISALDKHLSELHALRLALADAEHTMVAVATASPVETSHQTAQAPYQHHTTEADEPPRQHQPTMILPSSRPDYQRDAGLPRSAPSSDMINALQGLQSALLQKAPLTPAPMPMSEVFPDRLPEVQTTLGYAPLTMPPPNASLESTPRGFMVPDTSIPQAHLSAAGPVFGSFPQPVAPAQSVFHEAPPQDIRAAEADATRMQPPLFCMPPMQTQPTPAYQAQPDMTREIAKESKLDSQMEQATLEDLNAALAFAFSQVSGSTSQPLQSPMTVAFPQAHAANIQWQLPQRA